MAKHESFDQAKQKLNRITLQQNKNIIGIQKKQSSPFASLGRNTRYKTSKILYESDWAVADDREKIDSAITQEKGLLLPEKLNYSFSIDLNIAEQFLPYLQIELLAKTPPDMQMKGVFNYISSGKREISFWLYDWNGIGQMSLSGCGDTPQPVEAYDLIPADPTPPPTAPFWLFHYPTSNFPVPIGTDPSYLLPVAKDYIYPNQLIYDICGSPAFAYSSWSNVGSATFHELINLVGGDVDDAKDILNAYDNMTYSDELPNFKGHVDNINDLPLTGNEENDFYIQDNVSIYRVWNSEESSGTIDNWISAGASIYKAYQNIYTEQIVTAQQTKKITKISDSNYNLLFEGYILLLSEAKTQTSWSDLLTPTYEPNGGDIELKAQVYIKNPATFSELKKY